MKAFWSGVLLAIAVACTPSPLGEDQGTPPNATTDTSTPADEMPLRDRLADGSVLLVEVASLVSSPAGEENAVVLMSAEEELYLPIVIDAAQALSIAVALEGLSPSRPLTHDLMHAVIAELNGEVRYVLVTDLREGAFYARIGIGQAGAETEVDARPSDAIALAVRAEAPIYVDAEVMRRAGAATPEGREPLPSA